MANLEALWVAGKMHRGKTVLASEQAHYTHERISGVLGLPFEKVACDSRGRMDITALEERLKAGDVGCVVATLGTTGVGAIDPLPRILKLRAQYGFRLHVDAAYGGYFTLVYELGANGREAFDCIAEADSIVIDPHKHGLQPYGCGCVLFQDPRVGALYRHDSPYTYFSSRELHLGEISLECSRPGAAAVALWATQRLLPLVPRRRIRPGACGVAQGGCCARGAPCGRPAIRGSVRTGTGYCRLGSASAIGVSGIGGVPMDLRRMREARFAPRFDSTACRVLRVRVAVARNRIVSTCCACDRS